MMQDNSSTKMSHRILEESNKTAYVNVNGTTGHYRPITAQHDDNNGGDDDCKTQTSTTTTTVNCHQQQPVKLQPSWEENNLPEDELNFKSLSMDAASLELNTPPDKYKLVYCQFLLNGIGTLMAWNMLITANEYFTEYKLKNTTYVNTFIQYLTFFAQVPNVFFNWINIFVKIGGSPTKRIVWSITIEVIIFIITIILAMIDTSKWIDAFFWTTMVCVVLLNMANGIYQNTIYGMAAKLPPQYTGAVVLGSNISGTFTAIVAILSKKLTENLKMAAIYYFITALFVLLLCFDTYFALPLNRFYRHYKLKEKKEQHKKYSVNSGRPDHIPYVYIMKKAAPQLFNVFFVFLVTLSVFPAIQSNIQPSDKEFWLQASYVDVTCFLTFNVTAMIGSSLTSWFRWPSPKYLWLLVTLRVLFIPFFLLCNYQVSGAERILPIIIKNDWLYWSMGILLGLTSGYFSSLAMMYAPRTVEGKYASIAGMFAAAFLITGIFVGILSTFLWPWFIQHVGY